MYGVQSVYDEIRNLYVVFFFFTDRSTVIVSVCLITYVYFYLLR